MATADARGKRSPIRRARGNGRRAVSEVGPPPVARSLSDHLMRRELHVDALRLTRPEVVDPLGDQIG
jgi:hypothetical protein